MSSRTDCEGACSAQLLTPASHWCSPGGQRHSSGGWAPEPTSRRSGPRPSLAFMGIWGVSIWEDVSLYLSAPQMILNFFFHMLSITIREMQTKDKETTFHTY